MIEPLADPRRDPPYDAAREDHVHGEALSISERLVVSPGWGRLVRGSVAEGDGVARGTVVGALRQAARELPIVSPIGGVFLSWLIREGEWVPQGRPLMILLSADAT